MIDPSRSPSELNTNSTPATRWSSCWQVPLVALLFTGGVVCLAWLLGGRTLTEKVLIELISPVGLVWVLLGIQAGWATWQRQYPLAVLGLVGWGVLTFFGNWWIANQLVAQLESEYQRSDPLALEPLDRLVVLGGGTMSRMSGQPQLSPSGDRVALAAQMYHAGRVTKIICTGSNSFLATSDSLHCRQEAQQLLIRLGVPADAIELIEGENTSREIENLAQHLRQRGGLLERNGLLTSAWHLSRAMRLAEQQDLSMIPIPADFRSEHFRMHPNLLVPGAAELNTSRSVIKEYLGRTFGR